MKNSKILLLAALAFTTFSCDDFLDVKPIGKLIPSKVAEFENLLNNSVTIDRFMMDNNRYCFYAMMGDNLEVSSHIFDNEFVSTMVNMELLSATIFYDPVLDPKVTYMGWSYGVYQPVGIFNNVIKGVSDIDANSQYAKEVIAQAKVGRAWIYLNHALTYGPMYDPNGANDKPTVPLRTTEDPTVANGPLATTAQIFAQVIEDLNYACENCPLTVANPCRADRAAAYALRAEYYMYMRDWSNMLKDSEEAWRLALANRGSVDQLIYKLAEFKYVATTPVEAPDGCSEEYYMKLTGPDLDFEQTTNRENLLYRITPWGSVTSRFYPSEDWRNQFDKENDLRWKLFALTIPGYKKTISGQVYDDGPRLCFIKDEVFSTSQGLTYPLLLLMKAEAKARTSDLSGALSDLNLLRKYRYSGESTDLANGSSLSQDQLLEEILKERRKEQPLVSYQRTLDLKRYVLDNGKPWSKQTITHKVGNKVYSKPMTDRYFQSLPIDNAILEFNPQWGIELDLRPYEPYNAK